MSTVATVQAPFLSLDASGTVRGLATARHTRDGHILTRPPTTARPVTYASFPHRLKLKMASLYWRTLSPPQKLVYLTNAKGKPTTAWSLFLEYYFATLPDVLGLWHMDESPGALVVDCGPHALHLTATNSNRFKRTHGYARGKSANFPRLAVADHPALDLTTAFTFLTCFRLTSWAGLVNALLWFSPSVSGTQRLNINVASSIARISNYSGSVQKEASAWVATPAATNLCLAFSGSAGFVKIYRPQGSTTCTGTIWDPMPATNSAQYLRGYMTNAGWPGWMDLTIMFNRALAYSEYLELYNLIAPWLIGPD